MTDELPPLPEPKYIYHRSNTPGEDDLFEFAECGAVDTDSEGRICQGCERLYTASQVEEIRRAAVLAERERCAKVCEAEAESLGSGGKRDAAALCCAAAIRAETKSPE